MEAGIIKEINAIAHKDCVTNDTKYNRGLRRILSVGYENCWFEEDVMYYRMCIGL